LLPGTAYPELARAALREYGDEEAFEIRDLYFIRPLHVPDGESRDVRTMLRSSEGGYRFEVRTRCRLDGRPAWELNAQASVELGHLKAPAPLDLRAIGERCDKSRSGDHPQGLRSGQEKHVAFGPRWRVLREVSYGAGEALARLRLPDAHARDLDAFGLHPALLDYATGYAMDLIEGYRGDELWVPVSYGRIAVFAPLPQEIRSWVRNRGQNRNEAEFAVFDVTVTDEQGKVLVEIEEFTIKRLSESVDFALFSQPSRADVEFEAALGSGDARNLSPAELQLRRNYERGIRPEEGPEALLRVLSAEPAPQVVVSSLDLHSLIRQAEQTAEKSTAPGTKFERPELQSEYVAPHDELERTLVGYWEELLGVDKLGVADSFFELGGHSLIAVRLFAMIKKSYRVEFPISVLFEAPTIEGCARLIREARGDAGESAAGDPGRPAGEKRRTRYKHLVAMHTGEGGPRTPFFLVAGMFGNVLNLRHLANLAGTDRPFYGLQARGLYGDEPPHETFEEMAEAYIAEMRSVQPHGPYLLGGFSGGGLTAFEIAQQLRAAGEEVALLLLLDSALPQTPDLSFRDRAQVQLQRLRRRGVGYLLDYARNRLKWEMEKLERRFQTEEEGHTQDQFHNEAIERAFRAALPRYQMRHWPGKIVLFRPKLDESYVLGPGRILDSTKKWVWHDNGFGQYADSIEVFEMPGNHDSMVLEPNVRAMAAQLRASVAEAEAGFRG
jgi:thioesterase domain-containing protein